MSVKGIIGLRGEKKYILFKNDVRLSVSSLAWQRMQKNETEGSKKVIMYICEYDKYSSSLPLVTLATEEEAMAGNKPEFKSTNSSKVFAEMKEDNEEGDKSIRLKGDYLKNNGFTFAISKAANNEMVSDRVFLYQYTPNNFVLCLNKEIDVYEKQKDSGIDPDKVFNFKNLEYVDYVKECLNQ